MTSEEAVQLTTTGLTIGSGLLAQGMTAKNARIMEKEQRRTKKTTLKLDARVEAARSKTEEARARAQEADAAARQAEARATEHATYARYGVIGGIALGGALTAVLLVRLLRRP